MARRELSNDRKRWLLSSTLQWMHAVEEVNLRVAFHQKEAQESLALGPEKMAQRRSTVEPLVWHALRERFGERLGLEMIQRVMYVSAIDLHVLVIALEHINTSAPRLRQAVEDNSVRDTLKEYARLWKPMHKVSDALEHEEEYLAVPTAPASDNERLRHGVAVHARGGLRRRWSCPGFVDTADRTKVR